MNTPRYELSVLERLAICHLMRCKMWRGHFKFIDSLNNVRKSDSPQVTRKQREKLWVLVLRYERQFKSEAEKKLVVEGEKFVNEQGKQGVLIWEIPTPASNPAA